MMKRRIIRKELEEAEKIAELKDRFISLLDNMPGMTFTKDAGTGVYLACNQAFAEYAHKETPEGVIGLTDAEIFDPETAAHFEKDDKIALSLSKPYVFYEDVPDAGEIQTAADYESKVYGYCRQSSVFSVCARISRIWYVSSMSRP